MFSFDMNWHNITLLRQDGSKNDVGMSQCFWLITHTGIEAKQNGKFNEKDMEGKELAVRLTRKEGQYVVQGYFGLDTLEEEDTSDDMDDEIPF